MLCLCGSFFTTGYNFNHGNSSDFVCLHGPQVWMVIQCSVISSSSIWLNQIPPRLRKHFTVLTTVYGIIFLCWNRLLSWTCCLIWTSSFPGRRKDYWSRRGSDVSLNSLWTRESLRPVGSEHGWCLYTSTCTRLQACSYTILSLLLSVLSFWRSILTPAPILPSPLSK